MCQSITQQFISHTLKWYVVRATCFDLHWVIFRPSKNTDPRLHRIFIKMYCGIPNAQKICYKRGPEDDPVKVQTCHPDNILF